MVVNVFQLQEYKGSSGRLQDFLGAYALDLKGLTKRPCAEGTQRSILSRIDNWLWSKDPSAKTICWLSGDAGTGKSSIASTITSQARKEGYLAASYFFIKSYHATADPRSLFPTLAKELARDIDWGDRAGQAILSALQMRPSLVSDPLSIQASQLFGMPLRILASSPPAGHTRSSKRDSARERVKGLQGGPLLVVIDALDECHAGEQDQVVNALLGASEFIANPRVKILVTSRPTPDLLQQLQATHHNNKIEHMAMDPSSPENMQDIKSFFGKLVRLVSAKCMTLLIIHGPVISQTLTKRADLTFAARRYNGLAASSCGNWTWATSVSAYLEDQPNRSLSKSFFQNVKKSHSFEETALVRNAVTGYTTHTFASRVVELPRDSHAKTVACSIGASQGAVEPSTAHLHTVFKLIISMAFPGTSFEERAAYGYSPRQLLGCLLQCGISLSIYELAELLIDAKDACAANLLDTVQRLRSLLVPHLKLRDITLQSQLQAHKSFVDFLNNTLILSSLLPEEIRRIPTAADTLQSWSHRRLALRCFELLERLNQDPCGIGNLGLLNSEIDDFSNLCAQNISPPCAYASKYWIQHFLAAEPLSCSTLIGSLKKFLTKHLLHWLEHCSLLKITYQAQRDLKDLSEYLSRQYSSSTADANPDVKSLCFKLAKGTREASQYLNTFATPIRDAAPEVYRSALAQVPRNTNIWANYSHLNNDIEVLQGALTDWPIWSVQMSLGDSRAAVRLMKWSADSQYLAVSTTLQEIHVFRASNGAKIGESLKFGQNETISAIDICPDGKLVGANAWGCARVWDLTRGELTREIYDTSLESDDVGFGLVGNATNPTCITVFDTTGVVKQFALRRENGNFPKIKSRRLRVPNDGEDNNNFYWCKVECNSFLVAASANGWLTCSTFQTSEWRMPVKRKICEEFVHTAVVSPDGSQIACICFDIMGMQILSTADLECIHYIVDKPLDLISFGNGTLAYITRQSQPARLHVASVGGDRNAILMDPVYTPESGHYTFSLAPNSPFLAIFKEGLGLLIIPLDWVQSYPDSPGNDGTPAGLPAHNQDITSLAALVNNADQASLQPAFIASDKTTVRSLRAFALGCAPGFDMLSTDSTMSDLLIGVENRTYTFSLSCIGPGRMSSYPITQLLPPFGAALPPGSRSKRHVWIEENESGWIKLSNGRYVMWVFSRNGTCHVVSDKDGIIMSPVPSKSRSQILVADCQRRIQNLKFRGS